MDTFKIFTNADSTLKIVKVETVTENVSKYGVKMEYIETEAVSYQDSNMTHFSSEQPDNTKKEGYKRMERLSLELGILKNLVLELLDYSPTYQLNKYVRIIFDLPFKRKNTLTKTELEETKRILANKTFATGQIGFGITNLEEVLATIDSTWSPHEKLTIIAWNVKKVSRNFRRKINSKIGSIPEGKNTTHQEAYLVDTHDNLICNNDHKKATFDRMKNTFVRLEQLPRATSKTIKGKRSRRCAARTLIKESLSVVSDFKNFRVPCLNSSFGCPSILSPKMLGSHAEKCNYPPIKNGEISSSLDISKGPKSRFTAFCRTLELTNDTTLFYKIVSNGVKFKVQHKYMQKLLFKLTLYDANYQLISRICDLTSTISHHVRIPKTLCENVLLYTIKLPNTQQISTKN